MIFASLTFNTSGEYTGIDDFIQTGGGATHTHVAGVGFDGGGAAKFTPPTDFGDAVGLALWALAAPYSIPNGRRRVVRCLFNFGSQYPLNLTDENKLLIVNRTTGEDDHRMISRIVGGADNTLELCNNTVCSAAAAPFDIRDWVGQWVCFEWDCNLDTGFVTLYITTQDGTYDGVTPYKQLALTDSGPSWETWFGNENNWGAAGSDLGGHHNDPSTAHANNYFYIAHLVLADTLVGAPEGFLGGAVSAAPRLAVRRRRRTRR
jgi:hypothetical protein